MCWLCDHPDATWDDYLDLVREKIARFGWATQHVERAGIHPPWSYTVGLTDLDEPELVVTGLPMERASALLHRVVGHTPYHAIPEPGEQVELPGGPLIQIIEVAEPSAHLEMAVDMYGPLIHAVQVVHADDRGHWPWETGYRGVRGGQPVLGIVPSPPAAASAAQASATSPPAPATALPAPAGTPSAPAPAAAAPPQRPRRVVRTQPSRASGSRRGTRGSQRRSARAPSRRPSSRR